MHLNAALTPPRLHVSSSAPARVNILVMGFDFTSFYGGMIGISQFAQQAAELGLAVRWVNLGSAPSVEEMEAALQRFPGLESLTDKIEFAFCGDRKTRLVVSRDDVFVATQFLSAHVAADLMGQLDHPAFLYFVQDIENTFFPHGTMHALAEASYAFPAHPLFSYGFLSRYFEQEHLSVFDPSHPLGSPQGPLGFPSVATPVPTSVHYEFPVKPAGMPTERSLSRPKGVKRKLLFYARPEPHAARNMFDLGMMALAKAVEAGVFSPDEWEFHGIGSKTPVPHCGLPSGMCLEILPRVPPDEYLELLASYDIGLSLMLSPHPSIPPFDFAAAGLVTVTNTYASKDAQSLRDISSNLLPVPPTLEGIVGGLTRAKSRIDNIPARLAGAHLSLSSEWDDDASLGHRTLVHLFSWLPLSHLPPVERKTLVVSPPDQGDRAMLERLVGKLHELDTWSWIVLILVPSLDTDRARGLQDWVAQVRDPRLAVVVGPGCDPAFLSRIEAEGPSFPLSRYGGGGGGAKVGVLVSRGGVGAAVDWMGGGGGGGGDGFEVFSSGGGVEWCRDEEG